ncbi:MAG: flavodoxin domain-containing protein [Actinoplanes sp.]
MKILVSAASRHGATREVAAHIAAALRAALPGDATIDVLPAADVGDVTSYDAFVVGSAIYMGRWLDDARKLAELIATHPPRPVWLFSSGPVGDPAQPAEEPAEISGLVKTTGARDHRLLAGRLDRNQLGFAEKTVVRALRVPTGDFRNWEAITTWADHIAAELSQAATR